MIFLVVVFKHKRAASFLTNPSLWTLFPLRAHFMLLQLALDLSMIGAIFTPHSECDIVSVQVTYRSKIILSWVFRKVVEFIIKKTQFSLFQFTSEDDFGS